MMHGLQEYLLAKMYLHYSFVLGGNKASFEYAKAAFRLKPNLDPLDLGFSGSGLYPSSEDGVNFELKIRRVK